jgi:hypothetical protein
MIPALVTFIVCLAVLSRSLGPAAVLLARSVSRRAKSV